MLGFKEWIIIGVVAIDALLVIAYLILVLLSSKQKIDTKLISPIMELIKIITAGLIGFAFGQGGL